eukprot:403366772
MNSTGNSFRGVGQTILNSNHNSQNYNTSQSMQPARLQNLRQSMGDDRQSHHHSQSQNNNNPFNQTHQSMQLSLKPGSTTHAFMLHKRMSQERVPSKQGRMFHIELGQNEGPFKKNEIIGQPHIDKFGSTQSMNSTIGGQNSQMHGASQISPRIGILGHHQYKAEDRAQIMLADEATNSISQQIRRIEDSLVQGYELLNTYKSESENLRSQVDHLMTQLIEKNEGVLQEIHPDLIDDYKTLKDTIKEQKDENEQLYKLLLNLKKETASSSQKLQLCQNRIARLENNLGVNTNQLNQSNNDYENQSYSNAGDYE